MKLRPARAAASEPELAQECPPSSAPITEPPALTPVAAVLPLPTSRDRATLMILGGPRAGALYTLLDEATLIGRSADATITVDDPSVSRCHARILCASDGSIVLEDLDSTNGTFVGGKQIARALLSSGDRIQLGRDSIFRFAIVDAAEEALQTQLYEGSLKDTLTALANRRCLFERLQTEIWHARRERRRLGFLMIDIDHFKTVNDRFGHLAGDQVLRAIAQAGSLTLRSGDLFARYGGEELAVIARDAGLREATVLAERLRETIAGMRIEVGGGAIGVTVSVGVAVLSECEREDEGEELFARADARLYAAKRGGRNRVCAVTAETSPVSERIDSSARSP
jgi:two-component system, cell cycle response regulator